MCRGNNYCLCRHNAKYKKNNPACAQEITTACLDLTCNIYFLNPACAEEITTACADIICNTIFFKSCMCGRNNYCLCRNTQFIYFLNPAFAEKYIYFFKSCMC
jgi:hypothetical protein